MQDVSPALADPSVDWRTKIGVWLSTQGVSTILLFAILYFAVTERPKFVEQIQEGYRRNADKHIDLMQRHEKQVDRLLELIARERIDDLTKRQE